MEHLRWFVGNRNPSISEIIENADGTIPDLTGATVRFRMRQVGSTTLKVDQPISNVPDATGFVRYDWAAADVDTAADYLVWWNVTLGGKTQDMGEAMIEIASHAPVGGYVEVEELKSSLEITSGHADQDIQEAITAASNYIDAYTGRTFTATAPGTRLYTAIDPGWIMIDDVTSITSVTVDGVAWVENTDYYLEDTNLLRVLAGHILPRAPRKVSVTANFGFASVPPEIKQATRVIATQWFKRPREAPYGVLALALDGTPLRIGRFDSQLDAMLAKWRIPLMVE